MDIFIRNVPEGAREKQLRELFSAKLKQFGCLAFEVEKFKKGNCARLTLPSSDVATRFLALHGLPEQHPRGAKPVVALVLLNKTLFLSRDRFTSDPLLFQCLEKEDSERRSKRSAAGKENAPKQANITSFSVAQLDCGIWQHRGSETSGFFFQSYYRDHRHASLILGKKSLAVMLYASQRLPERVRIDVNYGIIEHISISSSSTATVTLTLREAPQFCRIEEEQGGSEANGTDISDVMRLLSLAQGRGASQQRTQRLRAANLHAEHAAVAGSCFVYRLTLSDHHLLGTLVSKASLPFLAALTLS